ncbi:hypothetical protein AOLI_G00267130 [Acnodon oligacanthus]
MDYRLLIRAFEHGVEDKTDSSRDRLYYVDEYISGQPRELIWSCLHMEPKHGYCEAKKLLQEHFGNEYTISRAYIEKALNWPDIKSDDGAVLQSFDLYLTGCRNAMADVAYMEELDSSVNMRSIISKLPNKLRERWRAIACGILDKQQRRVKFSNLVDFVNRQAREASHPVFGSIMEGPRNQAKRYTRETSLRKSGLGRVCTTGEQHTMEHCKKMKRSLHKDKIDFLRNKVLHMKARAVSTEDKHKGVPSDNVEGQSVVSGCTGAKTSTCGATTRDNIDSILAIVPIQVKNKKGNKVVTTYAFIDPGSTATFCTERLMATLNLTGRNTSILLKTMEGERIVTSHLVPGLEVSSLENNDFFELPNVFSQTAIPAREENIPRQEDVARWPHLSQVHLPRIQAGIDLLIGANVPRALEPWQGTTLNGQLLRGPDITSTLLGVIIRFRQEELAVMADVEAMFHQVKVPNDDADLLRKRATEFKDLDLNLDMLPAERALGVHWCIQSDNFKFKLCLKDKPPTRRNILSVVSSLYDPLGILAPVVLPAKTILQELCRLKIGWDELIPEHLAQQWCNWMKDLHLLDDFEVALCFKPIGFGDANCIILQTLVREAMEQ